MTDVAGDLRSEPIEERVFSGGDVPIAADVSGPADGPPVLLLHGGGQTRNAWSRALVAGSRRGYRMVSADLRGHGDSGWSPSADYDLAAHAADIGAIAAELSSPPFLVGASLGGMASLTYSATGAPIAGLVLVDIAPSLNPAGAERILAFMPQMPWRPIFPTARGLATLPDCCVISGSGTVDTTGTGTPGCSSGARSRALKRDCVRRRAP